MQAHRKKNPFFLAYIVKNLYLCSVKSSFFGHIIIIVTIAILASCRCSNTTMSLHEAQEVVAHADSLWHKGKMYGVDEGDSATLAQAYERLKELSTFSRQKSEYAHACYHYGKLLRAKDDPAAAMQAFIDATRSGTKDYHILGRVYSNIGDICHLAGDFQLSYDMFERSADMFLQNGDTLSYYYALNDMAFELAEQGKKLFDGLKALVEKNRYLLPVVDAIKVTTHFDDIWYIDSISITPEMVDGYMTAVTPVIDDTEATERLREKIINSFRKEVAGSPEKLDYNKPKVSVPEPNAWKKEYYEKIKPEEERRERSKAIIEEIRGSITEHDIMQEVGRRKLKAKLMELTDGEIAKAFPEDYKEFLAIPV